MQKSKEFAEFVSFVEVFVQIFESIQDSNKNTHHIRKSGNSHEEHQANNDSLATILGMEVSKSNGS